MAKASAAAPDLDSQRSVVLFPPLPICNLFQCLIRALSGLARLRPQILKILKDTQRTRRIRRCWASIRIYWDHSLLHSAAVLTHFSGSPLPSFDMARSLPSIQRLMALQVEDITYPMWSSVQGDVVTDVITFS